MLSALTRKAAVTLPLALAESTRRTYKAMFRVFLAFCVFYRMQLHQVTADSILAYLQFLADNSISSSGLRNHLSALKTQFALYANCLLEWGTKFESCKKKARV